jgi:pheromone a factor receptor
MALACTEILCTTPLGTAVTSLNIRQGVSPWKSWDDTHFGYSRIDQVPRLLWRQNRGSVIGLELNRWLAHVCAFVFFMFFGFVQEARRNYRSAFLAVKK